MKIMFNLSVTIEIPEADGFPPKDDLEQALSDFFLTEGMITHGLEVTNYYVDQEGEDARSN